MKIIRSILSKYVAWEIVEIFRDNVCVCSDYCVCIIQNLLCR